jgi:hypothetical protein
MSTESKEVVVVIGPAGVSPTQATTEQILHVDLLGTAYILDAFARVIAPGGAGIVVASMAGHRESPYEREIEQALATTATSELLADSEQTARQRENSQLTGRFRRWW